MSFYERLEEAIERNANGIYITRKGVKPSSREILKGMTAITPEPFIAYDPEKRTVHENESGVKGVLGGLTGITFKDVPTRSPNLSAWANYGLVIGFEREGDERRVTLAVPRGKSANYAVLESFGADGFAKPLSAVTRTLRTREEELRTRAARELLTKI